jgi:putative nucleotidyltransferase with HDIG domain
VQDKKERDIFAGGVPSLTSAIDAKSAWTRGHSERVTEYALLIGKRMGLDQDTLKKLELAALLHDIGKIGTTDHILEKKGLLTLTETADMRQHPLKGAEIVAGIKQLREVGEINKMPPRAARREGISLWPYGTEHTFSVQDNNRGGRLRFDDHQAALQGDSGAGICAERAQEERGHAV